MRNCDDRRRTWIYLQQASCRSQWITAALFEALADWTADGDTAQLRRRLIAVLYKLDCTQ